MFPKFDYLGLPKLVAGLLLLFFSLHLAAAAEPTPSYLFSNGYLIRMDPQLSHRAERLDLLVEGDEIVAIGNDLPTPVKAIRVDLKGGYLIPGLAEMHAHVPAQGQTYRDEVLFLYLANGITTIRGMLGAPTHLALRDALAAQQVLGPRLITSGPSFNGNSVSNPADARQMVLDQVAAGYDFLKIHPGLSRPEYDAIATTAQAAGIPFAGHVPAEVGLSHALKSGQASIDHMDGYVQALVPDLGVENSGLFAIGLTSRADLERIEQVVQATVSAGAAVVPTETLLENFSTNDPVAVANRPQNAYLPRRQLQDYRRALSNNAELNPADASRFLDLRKRLIKALHDGGALMLLGSDAPQVFNVPGFSVHRELASMTAAGLTPYQALQMGTANPAVYFGVPGEFGSLSVGSAADLVWLTNNPLDDIENSRTIQGVMVRGRWLDRQALDEGLALIAERHAD